MKIAFDITHPAHINLFRHLIKELRASSNQVIVILLDRGKIVSIAKKEFPEEKIIVIGKWYKSHFKKIFLTNLFRAFLILKLLIKRKPIIGLSSGSIPFGFACKLAFIPNIQISDDPERKFSSILEKLVATKKYYPPIVKETHKIGIYNCLKQWAYLSPEVFFPDLIVLKQYDLLPKKYIFIREISTKSLNYRAQQSSIILEITDDLPINYEVLFSLEDKTRINEYPSDWIVLKEPVEDIHSLMYYSKIVVSTGDSMAREGSLLGVPSIYLGTRDMAANDLLIEKNMLFKANKSNFLKIFNCLMQLNDAPNYQEQIRAKLSEKWDDLNKFMRTEIQKYRKRQR